MNFKQMALKALMKKAEADRSNALASLTMLLDHPAGIGDHSTEDYWKNANEALELLVELDKLNINLEFIDMLADSKTSPLKGYEIYVTQYAKKSEHYKWYFFFSKNLNFFYTLQQRLIFFLRLVLFLLFLIQPVPYQIFLFHLSIFFLNNLEHFCLLCFCLVFFSYQ